MKYPIKYGLTICIIMLALAGCLFFSGHGAESNTSAEKVQQVSDHFNGEQYFNPGYQQPSPGQQPRRSGWIWRWIFGNDWPEWPEVKGSLPGPPFRPQQSKELPHEHRPGLHMGPAEAVQAHLDLRAHVSIASHFQVFQLGSDGFYDAVNELASTLKEQNLKPGAFIAPEPGLAQEFTTPLIGAYNAGMPALSSLGSITPTIIRGYDPNTLWEKYQPGKPSDLSSFDPGYAFAVRIALSGLICCAL